MDLPCQEGQRGVGAAAPCTLHPGDALPFSSVAQGPQEAVCSPASSIPAASVSLLLLPQPGLSAPLGLCWRFLGWRDGEGRGKLSWKQVTCARSVVGMGVAMETASPNSILHPTPGAQLP